MSHWEEEEAVVMVQVVVRLKLMSDVEKKKNDRDKKGFTFVYQISFIKFSVVYELNT